ncbi:Glycosyl transferase family 2 [Lysobacter dokdonensis DS-58]|uniref:Glycosyl transferase family 2 n=1 Tax=Lysobacter dokdonensis DS-58 TaxID=1300345 RepID=A0A0A2WH93_9GAMM|nr:glycosyltransferase [Lysobacter dokdonensis]KGQ18077.1 Glycosyl transferase family 2 [Lysobacter dokdonensis DS-58]
MSDNPTATILVIAYKMEAMIGDAIRSALAQTIPCEIIVSDDCSPDGTLAAARKAVEGYNGPHRVTVRSTPRNLGLCAHLTELAGIATGDVLVFQAGDDVSYPQRVHRLLATFTAHPDAQVVGSLVDDIDVRGKPIKNATRGTPYEVDQAWLLRRGKLAAVLGASMAVRRTLLTDFPPMEGKVEDNMLTLRGALAGRCFCLQQSLLGYRRHDANLGDWVFDRSANDAATYERRNRRVLAMYREIAADQRKCIAARPDLPDAKRALGAQLADMYSLEADMREAVLDQPRHRWIAPLWRGLMHPGLRRKSAERAVKLVLPRSAFGQSAMAERAGGRLKDWNRRRLDARRIRLADQRGEGADYAQWVAQFDTIHDGNRASFVARANKLPPMPIAVVMPVYNPSPKWLAEAIDSVIAQVYPHWELCIADDVSTDPDVIATLDAYAQRDPRIRVVHRTVNGHISAASNTGLEIVTAPWITLLDHDDLLPEHALLCVAEAVARHPDAGVIYSDEDKCDEANRRREAFFKPDWNPDLARSYNMVSHFGAYRTSLLREIGGFRVGYEGAQDYDLMLRCVDRIAPTQVIHIPHVLYHWRIHEASTAAGNAVKPYALEAGRRAILEHLERNGLSGDVQSHPTGHYLVEYAPPAQLPRVTVVIADPGEAALRDACRDAVQRTGYPSLDLRTADAAPAALNAAVQDAAGELLVFIDGRCVPEDDTWLLRAVAWASRPNVGALGGKLFDSERHVIGNGVLINVDGVWSAMDGGARADGDGYAGRAKLPQNLSALMHGLVIVPRKVFIDAGGFDAAYATLTGAMLDLTLRIGKTGLRHTWLPSLRMLVAAPGNAFDANDADRRKLETTHTLSTVQDAAYNPNLGNKSKRYWYAHPPRV